VELVGREVDHLSGVLRRLEASAELQSGSQEAWEATTLCASAAEKIYTGCERVMAMLAARADGAKIDKNETWHKSLLDRMRLPFRERRAIVSEETYALLDRIRSFRHRERNTYGFDLDTEIVLIRANEAVQAYNRFAAEILHFFDALG